MLIDTIDIRDSAVLLDVDGTLLDIAATPLAVEVPPELKRALHALCEQTIGATAFVSGRPLTELDLLFDPLRLAAVAGHGAELRVSGKAEPSEFDMPYDARISGDLRRRFAALASALDGVILEDKGYSLALHYRLAPEHAEVVWKTVEENLPGLVTLMEDSLRAMPRGESF